MLLKKYDDDATYIYTLPKDVRRAVTPIGTITEKNVKGKRVDIIDPQLGRDL